MDALYLKENINNAISEALTSMVVSVPDDPIEYLGTYLLNYVERNTFMSQRAKDSIEYDVLAEGEKAAQDKADVENTIQNDNILREEKKLISFIENLANSVKSKEEAFASVSKFISEYLNIPAVYIAIKKPVGDSEVLHYFSASPGQEFMVGKKLIKPAEAEGDEAPTRQGLSFEAFKLPEVPEEEPVELEEGQEPPPPKPAPKPQPLVIDNTMRDTRCKFFGIPKLGSYVAMPFMLGSIEHDSGCILGPQPEPPVPSEDPEAPPPVAPEPWPLYVMNKVSVGVLIGLDTIGSYRRITPKELTTTNIIGEALISIIEKMEAQLFNSHFEFMVVNTPLVASIAEVPAKLTESEAGAVAGIAAEIGENPIMDTLKASMEADAIAALYTSSLLSDPCLSQLKLLEQHYLPPVQSAMSLLFGVLQFLGCESKDFKDVCGDANWNLMRMKGLPDLVDLIKTFDHKNDECPTYTDLAMKAYLETSGLGDLSILPPTLPVLSVLATWVVKVMASRDARLAYFAAKAEADAAAEAARLEAEAAAAEAAAAAPVNEEE